MTKFTTIDKAAIGTNVASMLVSIGVLANALPTTFSVYSQSAAGIPIVVDVNTLLAFGLSFLITGAYILTRFDKKVLNFLHLG